MATATVPSAACNHLHTESIPLIDLRFLSQSELLSLSFCSSCSSYSLQNDADVSTPKIDRSVFNESAGSRKQTFSRLRLAPRSASTGSSSHLSPSPFYQNPPLDAENYQIISVLKSLFGSNSSTTPHDDDDNLVSIPVHYNNCSYLPSTCNFELQNLPISIVDQAIVSVNSSTKKRKRGRPPRHQNNEYSSHYMNEVMGSGSKEITLAESVIKTEEEVLCAVEDPYFEELRKRTEGMRTQPELLGFLEGLDGEWTSNRKKKKVVDAAALAGELPKGWKVMLAFKKRANNFWLKCRSYISPNGQQFMSFKEVSLHLLSVDGLQEISRLNSGQIDGSNMFTEKKATGDAAGPALEYEKNEDLILHSELPTASSFVEHEKQVTPLSVGTIGEVQTLKKCKCHKCPSTFDEKDDLLQHLLSAHHRVPKKLKSQEAMNEEVIIKNGKYECQLCEKLFEERHRFNGHLGIHIKDYFRKLEVPDGITTLQKSAEPASVGFLSVVSSVQNSMGVNKHSVAVTSDVEMNDKMSSSVPTFKLEPFETNCGKQEGFSLSNFKLEEVNKDSDLRNELIVCFDAESTLVNNENNIHKSSVETNVFRCTRDRLNTDGRPEKNFQNCPLTLNGRDPVCLVDSNVSHVPPSFMEEDRITDTTLVVQEPDKKTFTSKMEVDDGNLIGKGELVISCVSGSTMQDDGKTDMMDQRSSEGCSVVPSVNDQRHGVVNGATGPLTSSDIQQSSTAEGLPSSVDEKICIGNNLSSISAGMLNMSKFGGEGKLGNNELTSGCGGNSITACADNVASHVIGSVITSPDEQMHLIENDSNGTPKGGLMKHGLERESEGYRPTLSNTEKLLGFMDNFANSNCLQEMPQQNKPCSKKSEFRSDIFLMGGHTSNMKLERSSNSFVPDPFAIRQTSASNYNGICNKLDKAAQDINCYSDRPSSDGSSHDCGNNVTKVSYMATVEHKQKDNRCPCDGNLRVGFGDVPTEQDATVEASNLDEGYFKGFVLSDNRETFAAKKNVIDLHMGRPEEAKLKGSTVDSLLCLSVSEQAQRKENNLFSSFTRTVQDKSRLEDLENPSKNKLEIGFSGCPRSSENTLSEFICRTDENDVLSGFADTSSRLVQSSNYFPPYELVSDKGGGDLFGEKFAGGPGIEGLRAGSMGNMEYNFLTSHVSSCSDESKIFSYDAKIAQKLDSTVWLEKEALPLLPKIAGRHHFSTVCVWCKNEFQHESLELEADISMGFSCEACKGKLSGQFNLMQNVVHNQFKLP